MEVTTYINEIYSETEVKISYKNTKEESIELIVEIPIRTEIIFNYFTAKINDKIIKSKVIETNKAEEKYTDAIASGNTGIATSYDSDRKIYSLKIGNLLKNETIDLKFSFIQFVNIKDSFYCINLIKDFPSFSDFNSDKYEGKIIIETKSEIINLIQKRNAEEINHMINYFETKQKAEIAIKEKSLVDKILFKTKNMEKPFMLCQYNPELNEMNYILNYYNINYSNINNKQYPCLFIFLIDQSGSMDDKIKSASKTLKKLFQKLPENSYYQLIGFGSEYNIYNTTPEKNTKENLEKAYEIIDSLEANLGGTNLSEPLIYIFNEGYSNYKEINLSKQIFVLTDGDINVGDNIIELIKLHNNEFRIYTIGIGDEVNQELIIKTSVSGNGSYYFISDSLKELDDKLFEILKESTKEYINNTQFILEQKKFEVQPVNKIVYDKESLNFCFIREGKEIDNINMIFKWENLGKKLEKKLDIISKEIIKLPGGDLLSKLIIGISLKYNINEDKQQKIKLSKFYQVLCDETTLYAEIEGDKSAQNKINTYTKEFSFPKINESYSNNLCNIKNYKKIKNPELLEYQPSRGRPRKYLSKAEGDFESTKYEIFFNSSSRCPEEGKSINTQSVISQVFDFIYKGNHVEKLFSHPQSFKENPILLNLNDEIPISDKPKNTKSCDEVFYEYLNTFKDKTNEKYFALLIKFVLLFRECYDNSKAKDSKEEEKKAVTDHLPPEGLPDLCNEFYGEFMEPNNFFDLDENDRNEIIEIILHFCIWLFKNEYTKSKLSLAN